LATHADFLPRVDKHHSWEYRCRWWVHF
jgi:hypothetical protein